MRRAPLVRGTLAVGRCWCGSTLTRRQVQRGGKFCCRSHATMWTSVHAATAKRDAARRTSAIVAASRRQAVLREVLADLAPYIQPDGSIDTRHLVRVVLKHRRLAYTRGWAAYHARVRRAAERHARRLELDTYAQQRGATL